MTRSGSHGQVLDVIGNGRLAVTLSIGRSALPVAGSWSGLPEVAAGLAVTQAHWSRGDIAGALEATARLWRLDPEDRLVVFWRVVVLAAGAQAGTAATDKGQFVTILHRARLLCRLRPMELADLGVVALELRLKRWGGRLLRDAVDACNTPGEIRHLLQLVETSGPAADRFVHARLLARFPSEQVFRLAVARQLVAGGRYGRALRVLGNARAGETVSLELLRLRARAEVAGGWLGRARRSARQLEQLEPVDETAAAVHLAIRLRLAGRVLRSAIRNRVRGWLAFGKK